MIYIAEFGLEIRTSPKVLSTSLSLMAFELENGVVFRPFEDHGQVVNIFDIYPARTFRKSPPIAGAFRVAFVRDPIERFQSMYRNRILTRHKAESWQFARASELGLDPNPSPSTLIKKLKSYSNAMPTIKHHSMDQVAFLGPDANYFHHIFHPGQVHQFEELISGIVGRSVKLPHKQKTQGKGPELTCPDRARLRWQYRQDYRTYGQFMG